MSAPDLDKLRAEIKSAREGSVILPKEAPPPTSSHNDRVSMRAGAELIGGVIGGLLFGYGIDSMFGTKPFGLVACLIGGIIAGFYGVYRATQGRL